VLFVLMLLAAAGIIAAAFLFSTMIIVYVCEFLHHFDASVLNPLSFKILSGVAFVVAVAFV
jgi:hypothetical protein